MSHDRQPPPGRYPEDDYPGGYPAAGRPPYPEQSAFDDATRIVRPGAGSDPWTQVGRPGWEEPATPSYLGERGGEGDPRYGAPDPRYGAPGYGPPGYPPPGYAQPGYLPPGYAHRPPGYAPPPVAQPHRRRGGIILGRIISGLVALTLLVTSGLAWAAVGGKPKNASDATEQAGSVGVVTQTTDAAGNVVAVPTHGMNILIVGSDSRTDAAGNRLSRKELKEAGLSWTGGGTLTDTIMIVHVPGNGAKATAISIPRDTWIGDDVARAPGVVGPYTDGSTGPYRANKINSFYGTAKAYEREYLVSQGVSDQPELERRSSEAGRAMLIKVLQQFTGVKIDHYAEVNLIGFYFLSQAIGGVPVCLVAATKEPKSGANFPAGHFEVTGRDALAFVRQRHGLPRGDLDRVRRQQAFLAGAADKILSVGTLTSPQKLSDLVTAANRSLVLDKNFDLLSFGQQMINLSSGNINFVTIPTHGDQPGVGTSALATDPAEVRQLFANLMTDAPAPDAAGPTSVDPAKITVDVQNGTETAGMAAQVGAVIAGAGFARGQLSDYPGVTPDNQQIVTRVHYGPGGKAAAKKALKAIGVGEIIADEAVAADHLLIVVGTDMPVGEVPSTPIAAQPKSTTLPDDAINAGDIACIN